MAGLVKPEEVEAEETPLRKDGMIKDWLRRGAMRVRSKGTIPVQKMVDDYLEDIRTGARVARNQFGQEFGGEQNDRNKFHITYTEPGFFGYNSWGDAPEAKKNSITPWINTKSPDNLNGSGTGSEHSVLVGEQAVHILLGLGSLSSEPKIERLNYEINNSPRAAQYVGHQFEETDISLKFFDRPIMLFENTDFWAELYTDKKGTMKPYFLGVSFIKGRASEEVDPAKFAKDSPNTDNAIVCNPDA